MYSRLIGNLGASKKITVTVLLGLNNFCKCQNNLRLFYFILSFPSSEFLQIYLIFNTSSEEIFLTHFLKLLQGQGCYSVTVFRYLKNLFQHVSFLFCTIYLNYTNYIRLDINR
jgi:hypothetical protein